MILKPVTSVITAATANASESELNVLRRLIDKLQAKRESNRTNQDYYDQKVLIKDLGISLPPQFRKMESVLGWPAKAVDVLADRIQLQGFQIPGSDDAFGLNGVALENDFFNEFSHAVTSALTHSVAFITVSRGIDQHEPEVLWLTRSAFNATGIWNARRRALDAGLTVNSEEHGKVRELTLYLPDKVATVTLLADGRARVDIQANPTGRVLMEPLVYGADLGRPFGRSRITPTVKSLTDSAIRTIVRSEVGAEFYATPQRYALGADAEAFQNKWNALQSKLLTISKDEDGDTPTIGQFPQMSMQPHTDQLRQWAALLAAECSIPLDELGFPSDNPASDSAIQSQRDPLRLRADTAIRGFQQTLRRLAISSVQLRDGSVPEELLQVKGWFAPTVHTTDAAAADAILKQVTVIPWLAESPVVLEKLGYSADAIQRLLADKRRNAGRFCGSHQPATNRTTTREP